MDKYKCYIRNIHTNELIAEIELPSLPSENMSITIDHRSEHTIRDYKIVMVRMGMTIYEQSEDSIGPLVATLYVIGGKNYTEPPKHDLI